MTRPVTVTCVALLMLVGVSSWSAESDGTTKALDAVWAEVSRTVAEGDFEGYAATYHQDAVLVSSASNTSYPIEQALTGWRQGFDDAKSGRTKASVEFRFTRRLNDEKTAHETGIFHYTATPEVGEKVEQYLHFEALLVRKDSWQMLMEFQKMSATMEEWAAAEQKTVIQSRPGDTEYLE